MTRHPHSTNLSIQLPSGRLFTRTVESGEPPSMLRTLRALREATHALQGKSPTHVAPRVKTRLPDGLRTPLQAAAKLGISLRTLRQHIASGALRPINIGHGKQRQSLRFTESDINDFITMQTRKDQPCPSTRTETAVRRSSISISKSKVIGFMEARNRRRDAKPKR